MNENAMDPKLEPMEIEGERLQVHMLCPGVRKVLNMLKTQGCKLRRRETRNANCKTDETRCGDGDTSRLRGKTGIKSK